MSMEESISLEETNKIRISLGLKPLTDNKAPVVDVAADNYAKLREEEAKERETKKIQSKIAKVRNRQELNSSLKGATLGDADDAVDDTLNWVKRTKRKEKELALKRQQELENRDRNALGDYSERDLEGLKVSHDFDEMDEGESRILTLKDSRILDNEEDELQNVEMAEEEKLKNRLELKVKKRDYTGYDDDEFQGGNPGLSKRSILAKYDEEIDGRQQSMFRLGTSTLSSEVHREEQKRQTAASLNKTLLTIDYKKNLEINDHIEERDTGFKKPKKKKKKASTRAPDSQLYDDPEKMNVDREVVPRVRNLDVNFVDDDELQAALARSRKAKLHKAKKVSPEELAKKIALERAKEEENRTLTKGEPEDEDRGLTFDETSEFVQAVGNDPIVKPKREPRESSLTTPVQSGSRDISMAPGDVALDELEAGEVRVKDEDDDIDIDMLDELELAIKQTEEDEKAAAEIGEGGVGTSSEQHFASGMAAALNILRQQGVLAQPNSDQDDREKVQMKRDFWLADLRRRQAQRELDRLQARGGHKDQAQREYENRHREQQEARDQLEMFKNYKPDIDLSYHDEHGRKLSMKEAWKALSHKFHGKGSGKMKTEKRLKKIAEEKKKEAMASGDTPLSMNRAFQIRQEKTGQAHFVLSVGNRGAVPQAADFLDPQPLAKGKTEKLKKKKESKNAQHVVESGFMTVPAPSLHLTSNGTSASASIVGSPAPRAGFSRITSTAIESSSQGSTPAPSERPKVAFGLGVKRKAGEEAVGTPPHKRR